MTHHLNHTIMDPRPPGFVGLMCLSISWIFTYMQHLDKSDISFVLSSTATILAIVYYGLQIKKIKKS